MREPIHDKDLLQWDGTRAFAPTPVEFIGDVFDIAAHEMADLRLEGASPERGRFGAFRPFTGWERERARGTT